MGLIEEILKYSKNHAQTIIVILLGVIIVGSIGGGMWIQNLSSSLSLRKDMEDQRVVLLEERYRNNYASLSMRVSEAENTIKNSVRTVKEFADSLKAVSSEIHAIAQHKPPSKESIQLAIIARSIQYDSDKLVADLTKVESEARGLFGSVKERLPEYSYPRMVESSSHEYTFLIYVLALVGACAILLLFISSSRNRRKASEG